MKFSIKNNPVVTAIVIGVIAFIIGWSVGGPSSSSEKSGGTSPVTEEKSAQIWTCSMHPQIKLPEPGQCPICFMDLIPLEPESTSDSPIRLSMSEAAMKLAEVETAIVKRDTAKAEVFLSGKVEYDETLIGTITAWIPGRLERLYVDYTGIYVHKGDHMVELYSPELYTAQEELIQAWERVSSITDKNSAAYQTAMSILEATREKFRLLGLTPEQISEIEQRQILTDKLTIYSPVSGVVIHKNATEGMYVKTGTPIYTIADLSRVWIILDAYESDISLLNYGQEVTFSAEAIPGRTFTGQVAFIDPVLNDKTRTVKVRMNIANEDGLLKPGMFIRATVLSVLDTEGNAINPHMAGKGVCPMHPEVVMDDHGICHICGMPLVRAEDMGIVSFPKSDELPLLVPASAVLITGKRAVVYVKIPDTDGPVFEGREVILGSRVGDNYIVRSGLMEGEEVVKSGNFKIDSAFQISAKPSMMNPEGGVTSTGHDHGGMKMSSDDEKAAMNTPPDVDVTLNISSRLLNEVVTEYLSMQGALANDDYQEAYNALMGIHRITMGVEGAESLMNPSMKPAGDIDKLRAIFEEISIVLRKAAADGKISTGLNEAYCPMAFDFRGAYWLQKGEQISNPYFGSKMLKCGEIRNRWNGGTDSERDSGDE